jgi:ribokinase
MTEQRGAVIVLASFMMDLVARVPRRPRAGESVIGSDFGMFVGGKGNNQAIAAARMGALVHVIGRLGEDVFATPFREALAREGIDATWVRADPEAGTGVAMPLVEPDGQNSIVAIPRANLHLSADDIAEAAEAFGSASVVAAQLEVPFAAVREAFERARSAGVRTIFNPAPAPEGAPQELRELLPLVDVIVPNEREAESLTGQAVDSLASAERAGLSLLEQGCGSAVITLGSRGALWLPAAGHEGVYLAPFDVTQVDATAAGDAFCGTLAAGMAGGLPMPTALRRACAAGALAVTRMGAEPSLPTAVEVDALLRAQPKA